ncbi:hypothetical protein [Vibrio nigripulchritudo]|uniref:hypothetical protein n=1 Tax=Vibrio nigripulchritudo TaxID=28173 RepID=UPI0024919B43|nr:hypothetical protein [Vibrio nigripulchritudo]BDU41131.1 hypothetical protein TUMSATVNIG2_56000 [Vibrio nigripulchritudo]BDU46871.1 hypothetical protein TUMSATVNIG3_56690 [Vibrio nigripulchritudo]
MARSFVLQTPLKGKLERDFRAYQQREGESDADVSRQLLELALRIVLDEEDDKRPSNRALLEENYRLARRIAGVLNLTHTQTFDDESMRQNRHDALDIREQLKVSVDSKVDKYLDGEP